MSDDLKVGEARKRSGSLVFVVATILVVAGGMLAFHWTVNRVYVDPGESLMLRYKGPLVFGKKERKTAPLPLNRKLHRKKYDQSKTTVMQC